MSTYSQIHIHAVFGVKNRNRHIDETWRDDLYKYVTGIIRNQGHCLLAINGTDDHVHILFGLSPKQSVSDIMREIKRDSSKWINENAFVPGGFAWQNGYGAFSYSKSQVGQVTRYIAKQKTHHEQISFPEEYKKTLEDLGITYKEEYLLE